MGNTELWLASIGVTRDGDEWVYDPNHEPIFGMSVEPKALQPTTEADNG